MAYSKTDYIHFIWKLWHRKPSWMKEHMNNFYGSHSFPDSLIVV